MRITDDHLEAWENDGYVVVEGFLTPEELEAGHRDLQQMWPTWEELSLAPRRYPAIKGVVTTAFPYEGPTLNRTTLHPELIAFAQRALETDDIVLAHSELLAKYAGRGDFDQPLHMDFGNNTLVVPPDGRHDQVASILYYTDVTIDMGPTHVVSFPDAGDRAMSPSMRSREDDPELYRRERSVTAPAGSLLLYTMRTFHRGSAMTASAGARFSHHVAWQRADVTWGGWRSFPMHGGRPTMDHLLEELTPLQREMIGFPRPGHPFWTQLTVASVGQRYPAMDMGPYLDALAGAETSPDAAT